MFRFIQKENIQRYDFFFQNYTEQHNILHIYVHITIFLVYNLIANFLQQFIYIIIHYYTIQQQQYTHYTLLYNTYIFI